MECKVLTLNIWLGGKLFDQALAFIKQENPDILSLQEVYNAHDPGLDMQFRTFEVLQAELGYPYDDFALEFIEDHPNGRLPQGNAVFSRYPIKAHHTTYFYRPPDEHYVDSLDPIVDISHNLQHLELETPGGTINYINFHGPKNNDGDIDSPERQTAVRILLEEIEGKQNVIITGDTNARPTNASIQKLMQKIPSIFGSELTSTFNMKQKTNPGYATSVVDMIFASSSFTILQKYQPQVDVSDHLPLVVRLRLG